MLDGITGARLLSSSPWVLLALAVFFLMRGLLVPRRTYDDIREDRQEWREAHRVSEESRIQQGAQIEEMLRGFETLEQLIRALRGDDRGGRT